MTEPQAIVAGQPVVHPGPVAEQRVETRLGRTRPVIVDDLDASRPRLGAGARLMDLMVDAVEAAGATSGIVEFGGIALSRVSYCFPAAGVDHRPMLYSSTHESSGAVLSGTATVGYRREHPGAELSRWVHFHTAWVDGEGALRGGHLWPETTAQTPLSQATVWPLEGMDLINEVCEETLLPVFSAHEAGAAGRPDETASAGVELAVDGDRRAVFARVRPNEEIAQVIARLTREHGLHGGSVRGGTGSLVGASFADGRIVDGPAVEVITLSGRLPAADEPESLPILSCSLIDARAEVHGGELAPSGNLVGVTFDLLLVGPREGA